VASASASCSDRPIPSGAVEKLYAVILGEMRREQLDRTQMPGVRREPLDHQRKAAAKARGVDTQVRLCF